MDGNSIFICVIAAVIPVSWLFVGAFELVEDPMLFRVGTGLFAIVVWLLWSVKKELDKQE